jgi:hypothetical protein
MPACLESKGEKPNIPKNKKNWRKTKNIKELEYMLSTKSPSTLPMSKLPERPGALLGFCMAGSGMLRT